MSSHDKALAALRAERDLYAGALAAIFETFTRAADGDLEARVPPVAAATGNQPFDPAMVTELRTCLNLMLDRVDSFVRESVGALEAAADGRFHRRFLPGGMTGGFRRGADAISSSRLGIRDARDLAEATQRNELADRIEETVLGAAEQVAASASELSATASTLSVAAGRTVTDSETASQAVADLEAASARIQTVVDTISKIAAQTKLLALNASIEASRAGESGRGFAVVADEVKSLAESTAGSTTEVAEHVDSLRKAAAQSGTALGSIVSTLRDMGPMVDAIEHAVDGPGSDPAADAVGLARLAELLRHEVSELLHQIRQG